MVVRDPVELDDLAEHFLSIECRLVDIRNLIRLLLHNDLEDSELFDLHKALLLHFLLLLGKLVRLKIKVLLLLLPS